MTDQGKDLSQMSFEEALRALEDVVRRLETGEVPLEESIDLYEKIVAGPDGKAVATEPFDAG